MVKGEKKFGKNKKGLVSCISLITLILTIETTSTSQPQLLLQQQYKIIGSDVFASTTDSNFNGIITSVIDGDTLDIEKNDVEVITIRLTLGDAPETHELGYNEAKDFVSQNCLDKPSTVDPDNNQGPSYGRLLAVVYCDGLNINEAIREIWL